MSAADTNRRALIQHEAIKAYAMRRGVTADAVVEAMENGNVEVREAVEAIVEAEIARKPLSSGLVGVYHEEEPASTEPVGMSGGTAIRLFVAGVLVVAIVIGLVLSS